MTRRSFSASAARYALLPLAFLLLLTPASAQEAKGPGIAPGPDPVCSSPRPHEQLDAALWVQTSAEYRLAASQAYLLASIMVERALSDPNWTAAPEQVAVAGYQHLEPAVILDVDETVLSNAPVQGRIIADDSSFTTEIWDAWVSAEKAEAIDGAREFLARLKRLGVKPFYVTNRDHAADAHTAGNLRAKGFPLDEDNANLLSKGKRSGWGSNKTSRRAFLAERFRILLLVGDDLNDFVTGARKDDSAPVTPQTRREVAERHRQYWGSRWIIIPNPMYGYWEEAAYGFDRSLCRGRVLERKRDSVVSFP